MSPGHGDKLGKVCKYYRRLFKAQVELLIDQAYDEMADERQATSED